MSTAAYRSCHQRLKEQTRRNQKRPPRSYPIPSLNRQENPTNSYKSNSLICSRRNESQTLPSCAAKSIGNWRRQKNRPIGHVSDNWLRSSGCLQLALARIDAFSFFEVRFPRARVATAANETLTRSWESLSRA